jgi:hypothetical protein
MIQLHSTPQTVPKVMRRPAADDSRPCAATARRAEWRHENASGQICNAKTVCLLQQAAGMDKQDSLPERTRAQL